MEPDIHGHLDCNIDQFYCRFRRGSVLTLEPFLSTGPRRAVEGSDGWTLLTPPGNYTAQFEHTIVITDREPIILTAA